MRVAAFVFYRQEKPRMARTMDTGLRPTRKQQSCKQAARASEYPQALQHFSHCRRRAAVAPYSDRFVSGMGGWGPILIVGVLCGAVLDARARDLTTANFTSANFTSANLTSSCGAELMPAGRVNRVIDGRSFMLDDGREVRLAALAAPPAETSSAGPAARAALAAMLAGQTVALRSAAAAPDRYGRTVAYAFTAGEPKLEPKPRSVVHAMLAAGQARLGTEPREPACAAELLSWERGARIAKLGLWSDPQYGILAAGDLTSLVAGQGQFAIVEGKVLSVRESGGTIYVNFGRRWSQALTVTISKRQERMFSGAGRNPKALESRRLRVRGWIEVRNGPRIEASRPEQIEFVEAN
ncbi:MAG: thermonuclease family protein [Xanthobacteraceae bacterium]|nr:thermonuclease family protein [Xanthobacteraceae bacterium]